MKKIIVILIISLIMGCSERTTSDTLQERNGLIYLANENEPFTGLHKLSFSNGKPLSETHCKYGKLDGVQTIWYPNDKKKSEFRYKDGIQEGISIIFFENGQKKKETNFKNGIKDGLETIWYEDGQKKEENNYKDDKLHGLITVWYENGQKGFEGKFKDGEPNGLLTMWYKNGQKKEDANYEDGRRDGLSIIWYENGQKKAEEYYKDGKLIDEKEYKKLENKESEVVNSNLVIDKSNTDKKFSFSSMLASLKSFFYKTLPSDAPADLHGTYSQKEFQNCCFEGEETTEKYHHLQLASPINVTGESDNSPEGEKVTITVDEVQISDIEGVKNGQVIDVHCDQLYFSPNGHYALSVYCSTPQKAEEQKEEQTNNESNFLSRESEKSYQKEGSEEVKNSTISKPPVVREEAKGKITTFAKNSDERKFLMDILRVPVQRELHVPIQFVVQELRVLDNWAFLTAEPIRKDGKEIDYTKTKYRVAYEEGAFDSQMNAIFKKTNNQWELLGYQIGATDVAYACWWKEYHAPKNLMPYSEECQYTPN